MIRCSYRRASQRQDCQVGDLGGESVFEGLSRLVAAHNAREVTAALINAKLLTGGLAAGFTRRDILQHGWSGLTSSEVVDAGLAALVERGILRRTHVSTRGRPKAVYCATAAD